MKSRGLPLAAWAALLSTATLVTVAVVAAGLLRAGAPAGQALAAGSAAGLLPGGVAVLLASRLGAALRALRRDAVLRLQDPSAPHRAAPVLARSTAELGELVAVLEALHLRVRLGDQVGERHRLQAETAGAGVFELLSGLVAAEEGTRGQLAAELHDTVAQSLIVARNLLAAGPATPAELAAAR